MQSIDHEPLSDEEMDRRLNDTSIMRQAMQEAIHDTLREHKRAGRSVCTWRDGKVVWIPPEEILADAPPQPNDQSADASAEQ